MADQLRQNIPSGIAPPLTLSGHTDAILSLLFIDDETLLSSGIDKTIRLWHFGKGSDSSILGRHSEPVFDLAFEPKSSRLFSAGWDHLVKEWSITGGGRVREFRGHTQPVNSVAVSSHGHWLASASGDRTVRLWNIESQSSEESGHVLTGHEDFVNCVAFNPQGDLLASGSNDGTVKFWEMPEGHLKELSLEHGDVVSSIAFHPNRESAILATGCHDHYVRIWNHRDGMLVRPLAGHTDTVDTIAFCPSDGRLLASKSADGTIRLWNWESSKEIAVIQEPSRANWWIPALAFHPTKPRLACAGSENGTPPEERSRLIHIWELDLERLLGPPKDPSPVDFRSGPAGYTPEFCRIGGAAALPDYLGVDPLAARFAQLIALRETQLPLAIGLFANWGTGKSHFMSLVDGHIQQLAIESRKQEERRKTNPELEQSPWHAQLVSVYFNAWHYNESNLWASLVSQIFDALFLHLRPKTDELELMLTQLNKARGATAQAKEEVWRAQQAVTVASEELKRAERANDEAQNTFRGLIESLKVFLPDLATAENREKLAELLQISPDDITIAKLREKLREVKSLRGRLSVFWRRAKAKEGLRARIVWISVSLVVPPLFFWLLRTTFSVPQISAAISAFIVGAGGAATLIVKIIDEVQKLIDWLEKMQRDAEEAQRRLPQDETVKEAKDNAARADARVVEAEKKLEEARADESSLAQAVEELSPEQRVARFIEGRAQSSDYRSQLGLINLARRDFEQLSELFADRDALERKIAAYPDEQKANIRKLSSKLDRIVLYIDDLDRCQPERVVKVLEAVHLLLAFPLFAVIVGVDQRCLRQSLHTEFKGLLADDLQSADHGIKRPFPFPNDETAERIATPLDYLEKIFHIPFHLPRMSEDGFRKLIKELTESHEMVDPPKRENGGVPVEPPNRSHDSLPPPANIEGEATKYGEDAEASNPTHPSMDDNQKSLDDASTHNSRKVPPPKGGEERRRSGSVRIEKWEVNALQSYYPLIRTPRGAKRLLNTYRLMRAGVEEKDWDDFRGDKATHGQFRLAMLLLAATAGYPGLAREWFTTLRSMDWSELSTAGRRSSSPTNWNLFADMCQKTFATSSSWPDRSAVDDWLNRVEQFAF